MKHRLKSLVGDRGVHLAQRLGRFRFLLKARRVREEGARLRDDPVSIARFVLTDPETHSYSYDLGNPAELVEFAADMLGEDRDRLRVWLDEVNADPELNERLSARNRWRIDAKTRMPLGNRLLWYLVIRSARPALVVETGIFDGLGSLMLLRALDRNAADGHDGRLLSIDIDPGAGWLVPADQQGRWERVTGDILTDLEPAIGDRRIDVFIHDSVHTQEFQRFEFGLALRRAARRLCVLDPNGPDLPYLAELARDQGGRYAVFTEKPARHFYRPPGTALAVFGAGEEAG